MIYKKTISILLILIMMLSLSSCLYSNSMEDFFEDWIPEKDFQIAIIDFDYNTITYNGETYDIPQNVTHLAWDNFCCMVDGKVYGIKDTGINDEKYEKSIDIFRFDFKTQEYEILHSEKCNPCKPINKIESYLRSPYYLDGNIVISDKIVTISYNVYTDTVEHLPPEAYSPPQKHYEFLKDEKGFQDYKNILIKTDTEERLISIDYMAERHEYIQRLVDFGIHKGKYKLSMLFTDLDPLIDFFNNSYTFQDKIYYFVCRIFDEDGERNGVVFSYNYENETFIFLYHRFTSGANHITLIPAQ